jgi:tetratricopeptide (TPR) repeat protein
MGTFGEKERDTLYALIPQDPQSALALARKYDVEYERDRNWGRNRGGLYIEIGEGLHDPAVISEGVADIESILPSEPTPDEPSLLYNLANGQVALHDEAKAVSGFRYDPLDTPLTRAKDAFRKAIAGEQHLDVALRAKLRVNYGNCLRHLGRPLEALGQYDRALSHDSEHGMAWGNLAGGMDDLFRIASDPNLAADARLAINEALHGDRLERIGEGHARRGFEHLRARLEATTAHHLQRHGRASGRRVGGSAYFRRYVEFCAKRQLFLNIDAVHRRHPSPHKDSVYFPLKTDLDDETTFPYLARVFNEAKEGYAVARLLLYEAVEHPYSTQCHDDLTWLAYNLDYSVHGMRPAKLKAAFATAYNVLDKLAVFVGRRLCGRNADGAGHSETWADRTDFDKLWFEDKDKSESKNCMRRVVLETNNRLLFGLFDMQRDLDSRTGYAKHLREYRNKLTHRYLVLHTEARGLWRTDVDGDAYHVGYREFAEATTDLLRLVRAAVVNTMLYVASTHPRSRRGAGKLICPIMVTRCEHSRPGPFGGP